MYKEWFCKNNSVIRLHARFGNFKASDYVGEIKDKVYILPSLCFYFNSSEFYIEFSWINFTSWFGYTNYNKKRLW